MTFIHLLMRDGARKENGDRLRWDLLCAYCDDERERRGVACGVGQILPRVQFHTAFPLSVRGDFADFCGQRAEEAGSEPIALALCKLNELVIVPLATEAGQERERWACFS